MRLGKIFFLFAIFCGLTLQARATPIVLNLGDTVYFEITCGLTEGGCIAGGARKEIIQSTTGLFSNYVSKNPGVITGFDLTQGIGSTLFGEIDESVDFHLYNFEIGMDVLSSGVRYITGTFNVDMLYYDWSNGETSSFDGTLSGDFMTTISSDSHIFAGSFSYVPVSAPSMLFMMILSFAFLRRRRM